MTCLWIKFEKRMFSTQCRIKIIIITIVIIMIINNNNSYIALCSQMSSQCCITSKSIKGQFAQKRQRLFFFNVLHTHTINNQKETALDRQGHNIKTQTFQTRIYSHRHCGENCYCFRTREMALYSVSVDCGIALHRDSL